MTSTRTAKVTLPADEQILIERDFDAPREQVWEAFTTPELVRRWWHARRGELTTCEIDFRVGGRWRYAMTTHEGGHEVAFHGEYREIVPDERLVATEAFEGPWPEGDPAVTTTTFSEADGRTVLTLLTEVGSRKERDAILETGMETGMQEQMDALEALARSL